MSLENIDHAKNSINQPDINNNLFNLNQTLQNNIPQQELGNNQFNIRKQDENIQYNQHGLQFPNQTIN
jgi:hypothetical protein